MHESVAGLTAEIGSKIYEGKIMTREEAEIKCDEAKQTNQACVRIEAYVSPLKINISNLNNKISDRKNTKWEGMNSVISSISQKESLRKSG